MATAWFVFLALMITVYVVLDGFDLGVGALHRLIGRTAAAREEAAAAIGPIWNGNAGWLIAGGGVLFLAFSAVPTRALILDQGKWWVMVHTATGDHPQEVIPGPTRGWQTFIAHGLEPGTEVVVDNAYLEFHRSISQRYQPPD